MFGIDLMDPETMWLNITNVVLGVVTFLCVGAVLWGIGAEVLARLAHRAAVSRPLDDHAFAVPGLGLTMADGGKKEHQPKK
ncbi:MAG: hypothetical protein WBX15_07420 [Thermoanaerobaculia bacterium]